MTLLSIMTLCWMTTRAVFESHVEQALAPGLSPGQVVVVDNHPAHKDGRIK